LDAFSLVYDLCISELNQKSYAKVPGGNALHKLSISSSNFCIRLFTSFLATLTSVE